MYVTLGTSLCIPTYKQRDIGNSDNECSVHDDYTRHCTHNEVLPMIHLPTQFKVALEDSIFLGCYTM